MPEPTSNASGVALAAGVATISGSLFGIEYLNLMWGFVGGVTALIYLPQFKSWWHSLLSVLGATVLGGVFSPVGILFVTHLAPWVDTIHQVLEVVSAFGIGFTAQISVPAIFNRISSQGKRN